MEKWLRDWRQDALNKGQYEAAIWVGDKLLAKTRDDKDAFWLAQVYFTAGHYTRAQTVLERYGLVDGNVSCRYLAAHCLVKREKHDEALQLLGEGSPSQLFVRRTKRQAGQEARRGRREIAGSHGSEREEEVERRKFEASMCYLRGLCFARTNALDRAKEAFKDALRIDVQCHEAFGQLVKNWLMSPQEEDEFMQSLDFGGSEAEATEGEGASAEDEAAGYLRMLYHTQLSKYRDPLAFQTAVQTLTTHYGLAGNADLVLSQADLLYTQCRFREAMALTESMVADEAENLSAYPLHLACLYELGESNRLFLLAHGLAERQPKEACAWLAVATYYLAVGKTAEARRYFSKASMMDASSAPAWIGFAHTFAAEGEHDQAVTAYSTAARLFSGTHLPALFLGMQHHAMNHMSAAEEFLKTALSLCKDDPLLLNEMGIVLYHQDRLPEAAEAFAAAVEVADGIGSEPTAWLGARTNLGHAYRRLRKHGLALEQFETVLRDGGRDCAVLCAKAVILLERGDVDEAVGVLHDALAVRPQDGIATELLNKALEESATGLGPGPAPTRLETEELDRFEDRLADQKRAARKRQRTALREQRARAEAETLEIYGEERRRIMHERQPSRPEFELDLDRDASSGMDVGTDDGFVE